MRSKILKIILIFLTFLFIVIGITTNFRNAYYQIDQSVQKSSKIKVIAEGAIEFSGEYYFDKGITLREVLFMLVLKKDADTSKLNLEMKINKELRIKIPYKQQNNKIKFSELEEYSQIKQYKIPQRIFNILIEYKQKGKIRS